jgi:hypothetical protein
MSITFCSSALGEQQPWTETNYSFGLPFFTTQGGLCPRYPEICLADSIRHCYTKVALLSKTGICSATTSFRFQYEVPGGAEFEATALDVSGECRSVAVAVLGVDAKLVRLEPLEENRSPVSMALNSEARELLRDWIKNASSKADEFGDIRQNPLSSLSPKALKGERVTLLRFELNDGVKGWKRDRGPVVLYFNDRLFRLEGWCTDDHLLFSVNDKLHLAYTVYCCGCGLRILCVYDLSGEAPMKVYENSSLSD